MTRSMNEDLHTLPCRRCGHEGAKLRQDKTERYYIACPKCSPIPAINYPKKRGGEGQQKLMQYASGHGYKQEVPEESTGTSGTSSGATMADKGIVTFGPQALPRTPPEQPRTPPEDSRTFGQPEESTGETRTLPNPPEQSGIGKAILGIAILIGTGTLAWKINKSRKSNPKRNPNPSPNKAQTRSTPGPTGVPSNQRLDSPLANL